MPQTENEWLAIAEEYAAKSNFPHCLGAMDGKHVAILSPANSGSLYHNYKHFFSVVLLALVDANCRFTYVDIGAYGRSSDGGIFNNSSLAIALESNQLHVPPSKTLPGSSITSPYVVVADDAFALKTYLLKPYSLRNLTPQQRIFNYRLSRARRTAENAFGQLSQRFRVFGRPMPLMPEKVQTIVMAACCLHNFLLRDKQSQATYMPESEQHSEDGQLNSLAKQGSNHASVNAQKVRDNFCSYFNSPHGSVCWQETQSMEL